MAIRIQVRPIDIKRWHGKTGQESFTRPKIIQALVDPNTMCYQTGLTKENAIKYGEILKLDLSDNFSLDTPIHFGIVKQGRLD